MAVRLGFLSALSLLGVTAPVCSAQSARVVQPEMQRAINEAIDRGIAHLQVRQHRDGTWTGSRFGQYPTGPTAFCSYALVESGVRVDSASIQLAVDFLKRTPPKMTYSAGCVLMLLAEIGEEKVNKERRAWVASLVALLEDWESSAPPGTYGYPTGRVDLSNTIFVALGFRAAASLGAEIPLDLSKRIVRATIKEHQEEPFEVEALLAEGNTKRSRSDKRMIAGFTYWVRGGGQPARASMTAGGVGTLQVLEDIHGKKLGRKLTKEIARSRELGVGWLETYWSVTENHGHGENQLLYHLWAIERLGAFLQRESFAGHPWYVEGAEELLKRQNDNGGWGSLDETCYALLFLSRASQARVSSGRSPGKEEGVHKQDAGAVQLRATGAMSLTAWIQGIDLKQGDRVEKVEWLIDDEIVETRRGDPLNAWRGERFAFRWNTEAERKIRLRAKVYLIQRDGLHGTLDSEALEIDCKLAPGDWIQEALPGMGPNLLLDPEVEFSVLASSEAAGQFATRAIDGFEGTAWVPAGSDAAPTLTIELSRALRAEAVTFSQAASSYFTQPEFTGVTKVRLTVNGEVSLHDVLPRAPGIQCLALPKSTRIRTLTVELLETDEAGGKKCGIAEVGLR